MIFNLKQCETLYCRREKFDCRYPPSSPEYSFIFLLGPSKSEVVAEVGSSIETQSCRVLGGNSALAARDLAAGRVSQVGAVTLGSQVLAVAVLVLAHLGNSALPSLLVNFGRR